VLEAEKQAIHSTIRGPGQTWLNHKDTWFLKENFGQARSIVPLEISAQAAKARVLHFCGRFEDGSTIAEKAMQLESLRGQHNFPYRNALWKEWYDNSHCKRLMENKGYLQNKGITAIKTLYRIAGDKPIDDWDDKVRNMQKKRFQKDFGPDQGAWQLRRRDHHQKETGKMEGHSLVPQLSDRYCSEKSDRTDKAAG
jgi:hypothetical protein